MATIKSYTTVEQSRKLTKILPLESADMHYVLIDSDQETYSPGLGKYYGVLPSILCWSLTGLLSVLPKGTDIIKEEADTENERYMCTVGIKDDIISTFGNNPVDACYEMIIKFNEQKLL